MRLAVRTLTMVIALSALGACAVAPLSPISLQVESASPAVEAAAPIGEYQSQCTPDGSTWYLLAPADGSNAMFYLEDGGHETNIGNPAGQRMIAPDSSNEGLAYVDGGERTRLYRPDGCGITS